MSIKQINSIKELEHISPDYWISSDGYVISYRRNKNGKIMKGSPDTDGYIQVKLNERKLRSVHGLVAMAFIENPENKPQVNHINGIPCDNRVENLEWVTNSENQKHAYRIGLQKARHKEELPNYNKYCNGNRIVLQYSLDGKFIREYPSIAMATREMGGKAHSTIQNACNNSHHTAYGYKWKYKEGSTTTHKR